MSDSNSELLQKWSSAIKQGDPKQVTNLYHENGTLLGTFSTKERSGHTLILEYFEQLLKNIVDVEFVSEHVHDLGSLVVNSGRYNFIINGETMNARFSFVYVKENTEWTIALHHSSVVPKSEFLP